MTASSFLLLLLLPGVAADTNITAGSASSNAGEKTGLKVKVAGYPTWCATVPFASLQYIPECRGYAGSANTPGGAASCANWCKWVPLSSMHYVTACSACSGQVQPIEGPAAPLPGCADWCGWSPAASWQYITLCPRTADRGDSTPGMR